MENIKEISVFWFRRDLRLHDNAALFHALKNNEHVLPIFIFDTTILDLLDDRADLRVNFIHQNLAAMQRELVLLGSNLDVWHGKPLNVWAKIIEQHSVVNVYANHDYEPKARSRDRAVFDFLKSKGISFKTFKDQCVFEYNEVLKDDGKPYTVFTPYSRKWKLKLNDFFLKPYPTKDYFNHFIEMPQRDIVPLQELGFEPCTFKFPTDVVADDLIANYAETRNFPAIKGTSRLSIHLRFGTVSIRELARRALVLDETWLNELIWRDFYMSILWHFPHSATEAFKSDYNRIEWRNNEVEFAAWCAGKTGYPIVDAGMRELNETGFMHNRVRMIVASFLVKHLLIDWRWGEAYFAKKLLDFDQSANVGGWQWAAGSGCDAAPYFRVFNPSLQTDKFDKNHAYIKRWVPEYQDPFLYPKPIVIHEFARKRCLEVYAKGLKKE